MTDTENTNAPKILIAGVGNLFMADDAFGCEVARLLTLRSLPPQVNVVDFGIRSLDLTYELIDGYDAAILIDAAPRGQAPGTLYVIEPHIQAAANVTLDAHGMDVVKVLQAAASLGTLPREILLVACEPTPRDADADWEMSLSPPVKAAVDEAVKLVESLVIKITEKSCGSRSDATGGTHHECVNTG